MNGGKIAIVALILAMLTAPSLYAYGFSFGVKLWPSVWTVSSFPVQITQDWEVILPDGTDVAGHNYWEHTSKQALNSSILYGVYASFSFSSAWAVSLNYARGNFDLDINGTFPTQYTDQYGVTVVSSTTYNHLDVPLHRQDLDLVANCQLNPRVSLFLGYKFLGYAYDHQDFQYIQQIDYPGFHGVETQIGSFDPFSGSYQGPAMGVASNTPLGESHFKVFGAASFLPYLFATGDIARRLEKKHGIAFNLEGGVSYVLPSVHLEARLSYRFQRFQGFKSSSGDQSETHTFPGATFGVSYYL